MEATNLDVKVLREEAIRLVWGRGVGSAGAILKGGVRGMATSEVNFKEN